MKKTRANRSSNSGPALDPKIIVAVVIVILVALLFYRKRTIQEATRFAAVAEKKVEVRSEPVILNSKDATENNMTFAKDMLAGRRDLAARNNLGFKSAQLKTVNGKVLIPFEFVPRKVWCQGGDIDTMKYASSSRTEKEFLVSLESISGNSVSEGVHVSVNDLYKGINHVFKVEASANTQSLALRICADKKKTGSCSRAIVIDQTALNDVLGASAKKTKENYVFYFQHLILSKNKIQAYRTDVFTDKFKKSVTQYLANEKVEAKDLQLAFRTTKTIRSNPPDIVNGKITLTLPYNDPRCMAGR